MKKGPLVTLVVVALVAAGLLVANQTVASRDDAAPTKSTTASTANDAAPSSAAAATPFAKSADYAGTITPADGAPIALSIAVDNDKAVAYACDGNTVESWLRGSAANGTLDLTAKDGAELTGQNAGAKVTGKLQINGTTYDFTAEPVSAPAGIYVYNADDGGRGSWVVSGDGSSTGVLRAADGTTSPGPALDPSTATTDVGGKTVTATRVEGDDDN